MARRGLYLIAAIWMVVVVPMAAAAAPYAAMVMDARSGEVLHARNADTRLHPASLTKMMTLYVVFQAVERGEISLDTRVRVSKKAAAEQPSKIGLRAGQMIKLRYLIRAAAVKSANDASTAMAEAISGSEAAFARRMNRTARALGMTRSTFKNAHGLTEKGHMSTARDMTTLGRRLFYDYPDYYNLFSRQSANVGRGTVYSHNRLLKSYRGADGIKTGYTRAAGYNLVASAERGRERVIATVFGGRSTASRNAKVAQLLDLGFRRAPTRVATRKPVKPAYIPPAKTRAKTIRVTSAPKRAAPGTAGKTIRIVTAVRKSLRPKARPGSAAPPPQMVAGLSDGVKSALAQARQTEAATTKPAPKPKPEAGTKPAPNPAHAAKKPKARPANLVLASARAAPTKRPKLVAKPLQKTVAKPVKREVVTRISTSGGRHWGINVGRYGSRYAAERVLLKTALAEMSTLDGSLRKVNKRKTGYDANFMGLTRDAADLACRRLQARKVTCFMIGPRG